MKNYSILLESGKTVFDTHTVGLLLGLHNKYSISNALQRMKNHGKLIKLQQGIWGLKNRNTYELGITLMKPSYISVESVLFDSGIIFQSQENTVSAIASNSKSYTIKEVTLQYYKIASIILLNPLGLINRGTHTIASPERALCDRLYLTPGYYFDNLHGVHRKKCLKIGKIYNNKRLLDELQALAYANGYTAS